MHNFKTCTSHNISFVLVKKQMSHEYWPKRGDLSMRYGNMMVKTLTEKRTSFDAYQRTLEINHVKTGETENVFFQL